MSNDTCHKTVTALTAAGVAGGQRHAHSLIGDDIAEARPGYVVKVVADYAADVSLGEAGVTRRVMVDHQGPGQKAAVVRYAAILRASGLTVELRAVSRYRVKVVVWVMDPL